MVRLPPELRPLIPALHRWAQSHPQVGRIWLYGSRVRGTHRPDSDLDVAIEVARPLENDDEKAEFQQLLTDGSRYLSAEFGLVVSLQAHATPGVDVGVEQHGVLVYELFQD